jgi:hypothetical protein
LPLEFAWSPTYTWAFTATPSISPPALQPSMEPKPTQPASSAPPASSVRLFILLGLLAVVVGAYGYDYFVAKPACEAADKKIQEFVDARNKESVTSREGSLVTSADIQKELGMQPTYVEKHDDKQYTVEYYCWWGKMPLLSRRRHFISVVYVGNEPRRVSSHHREEPPAEALPIDATTLAKGTADTSGDSGAESAPAAEEPAGPGAAPASDSEKPANEGKPAEGDQPGTKKAEEASAKG